MMEKIVYTKRIKKLRNRVLDEKPSICTERAKFYTEAYMKYEAMPVSIKRAMALKETLVGMTISIEPGELIVGNHSSKLMAAPFFPEYATEWMLKELDEFEKRSGDAYYPTGEAKVDIRKLCPFWKGKTTLEKGYALMPKPYKDILDTGIIKAEGNLTSGDAHIAIHHEKVLRIGLQGYKAWALEKRDALQLFDYGDLKKEQFYRAVQIGLEGLSLFIKRFATLAKDMAGNEANPQRRKELLAIHGNCGHIIEKPPENFYQALQLTYFLQLVLQIESNGHSLSFGRMDQYLYPFYSKDIRSGKISKLFARELLECTWIKIMAIKKIRSWSHTKSSAGGPLYQNVTIGGQTPQGLDAVNELSYLILESVGRTKLTQPNLTVRYHKNMSKDFMKACLDVIRKGFGMPAFNNDEIVIDGMVNLGIDVKDAYNYSAIGCIEVAIPGTWGYRVTGMSFLNLMRVFMATLHNGYDNISGVTLKKGKGTLKDFKSFDDLMMAWKEQIEFYTDATVAIDTAVDTVLEENVMDVLCSAFTDNCIESGKFIKEGGSKYDFISGLQVGIANLGNSFAAIKKLVFEEDCIDTEELMAFLDNNFEGIQGERVRQILLNYAPKYGNDEDYTDKLLSEAYLYFIHRLKMHHTTRYGRGPIGCRYFAGTSSISANVPSGAVVKATPDGRKAYSPLAEGSSPSSGTDVNGPTAVFKSVSKLPTEEIFGGVLLNQKVTPQALEKECDREKLITMIRTFFDDLKGWHVQYNVVSRETLLDAQIHPENYKDLVVRVAGYSAFFNNLSPEAQDDIIMRTEHTLRG